MPCKKCEEGKYKWGETGECQYDSLEACESANHKYKMQPTPLGKKTYEEYAKELKEFKNDEVNLSKAQKVNLGALDDLRRYQGTLIQSTADLIQLKSLVKSAVDRAEDALKDKDNYWKEVSKLITKGDTANSAGGKLADSIDSMMKDLGLPQTETKNFDKERKEYKDARNEVSRLF